MVTNKYWKSVKAIKLTLHNKKIESMKKVIKSHRSALDFNKVFFVEKVSVADFDYVEEVEMEYKNQEYGIKPIRDK